jgi:peptidoglycan hydrolase-like protein with peptidoglycan-binding domain
VDVYQLEANLVALGYDPDGDITVDNHFDTATKTAVKAWQTGYGMKATGQISLGTVVFLASSATVSQVNVAIGDNVADGAPIVLLAGAAQEIVIDVPDGLETYLTPGVVVQLTGDAEGTVSLLRSVEREGEVVVQAIITPSTPLANATSGTIVKVRVPTDHLDGVLIVPREALVSRLDGTYAVQVVTAPDTTEFRSVTVLGESGSDCAISGDGITTGAEVLLPV